MRRMVHWLGWLILAAATYAVLAFGASRMMYYPVKYPGGNWSAGDSLGAKDIFVRSGLHAWYIERPGATLVTLHLHGNGGNITHRTLAAEHILQAGSSVLLLDYSGYGRSSGRPTESVLYQDATDAFDWLKAHGHQRIVLHGESLGTPVAVEVAMRRRAAGLILEAPFTSARAVAGRVLPFFGPLLVRGYDALSKIGRINVPLLVIHGDQDEVIAYEFGQELYRAAPEPKSFWTIPAATHNDLHLVADREFPSRLRDFYATLQ